MEHVSGVVAVTDESISMTGWVLSGIASVISVLASCVAYLFKLRENQNSKQIKEMKSSHADQIKEVKDELKEMTLKANECHEERADMRGKIEANTVEIRFLTAEINQLKKASRGLS